MFNAKESIMNEVNKIVNPKLKEASEKIIADAPDSFWNLPASSSGKYHPQCDLGHGGLVRHSIMTAIIAYDLVISEVFVEDTQTNRDLAIFTGLFHDVIKYEGESTFTDFKHPITSGIFVKERLVAVGVDEDTTNVICKAIYSHMGKWTTSKYFPGLTLDTPITAFQKLIHVADYMASRKYIGGMDDWGYIFTNNKYSLSKTDKEILRTVIDKNLINDDAARTLGIARTNKEILEIWNSIIEKDQITERQSKYLDLAKQSIDNKEM